VLWFTGVVSIHVNAEAATDLLQLANFIFPASSASASMTALALNAGSNKAAEWFYLSENAKSQAARSIKNFELTTRLPLSHAKVPFFCSTILYLQGAAMAIHREAAEDISAAKSTESVSYLVASLLNSYPSAVGYDGYCIQLFPSPTWRDADPPCEGKGGVAEEEDSVALFSLKCLASSDFDYRTISQGYRQGGVSALTKTWAEVVAASPKPVCAEKENSKMITNLVGMAGQAIFTQLMVGPVCAMLTMGVKEVCNGGFAQGSCLRFENVIDVFFESLNAADAMTSSMQEEVMCLVFRRDINPFDEIES